MFGEAVERWRARGGLEEVNGRRLFVLRRPGSGPTILFLHGFPTASFDFHRVVDLLDPQADLLLFDMLGFGLSEKPPDHLYSLAWQADAAEELVRRSGAEEVRIVAHDMGTSVATELFARALTGDLTMPLTRALLFNGSILLEVASPTAGQRLLRSRAGAQAARLTTQTTFSKQFARVFSPSHPLSKEDAAEHWALVSTDDGHRIAHRTIHYMEERERLTERWHGAFRDWPGELSLIWGLEDPVATTKVLTGLRALRPGMPVKELPGIGHYPQLEDPRSVAGAITALAGPPADRG